MPVIPNETSVSLKEVCSVEEAETLLGWLHDNPEGTVDLKDCQHLHTAVLQVLMISKPEISTPPDDPYLREWILPAISGEIEQTVISGIGFDESALPIRADPMVTPERTDS